MSEIRSKRRLTRDFMMAMKQPEIEAARRKGRAEKIRKLHEDLMKSSRKLNYQDYNQQQYYNNNNNNNNRNNNNNNMNNNNNRNNNNNNMNNNYNYNWNNRNGQNQNQPQQDQGYMDANGYWSNGVYFTWEQAPFDMTSRAFKYSGCAAIKAYDEERVRETGDPMVIDTYAVFRLCPADKCNDYSMTGCSKNYGEYAVEMKTYLSYILGYYENRYDDYCEYCLPCDWEYQAEAKSFLNLCYATVAQEQYLAQQQTYQDMYNAQAQVNQNSQASSSANGAYNSGETFNTYNRYYNGASNANNNVNYGANANYNMNGNNNANNNVNGANYNGNNRYYNANNVNYYANNANNANNNANANNNGNANNGNANNNANNGNRDLQNNYYNGAQNNGNYAANQYYQNNQNQNNQNRNYNYLYGQNNQNQNNQNQNNQNQNNQNQNYQNYRNYQYNQNQNNQNYQNQNNQNYQNQNNQNNQNQNAENQNAENQNAENQNAENQNAENQNQYNQNQNVNQNARAYGYYDENGDWVDGQGASAGQNQYGYWGQDGNFYPYQNQNADQSMYSMLYLCADGSSCDYCTSENEKIYSYCDDYICGDYYTYCSDLYGEQDDLFDPMEFLECAEWTNQYGQTYYIGPHCGSDHYTVSLGVFSDENCLTYIGNDISLASVLGFKYSDQDIFKLPKECISCDGAEEYEQNQREQHNEGRYGEYVAKPQTTTDGIVAMCSALYSGSAQCNMNMNNFEQISRYMSQYEIDQEARYCAFIENIISGVFDESGEIMLKPEQFDFADWRNPHQYKKLRMSVGQAVGLSFSIILCVALLAAAAVTNRALTRQSTPWKPKRELSLSRQNSGILMGRSRSGPGAAPLI